MYAYEYFQELLVIDLIFVMQVIEVVTVLRVFVIPVASTTRTCVKTMATVTYVIARLALLEQTVR